MSGGRCTGHCCESFSIGMSPLELARAAHLERHVPGTSKHGSEILLIAEMLVPIGIFEDNPGRESLGKATGSSWFFTCSNLTHAGDCGIYATRPKMCSDFPRYDHGGACRYTGCEAPGFREPLIPATRLVRSASVPIPVRVWTDEEIARVAGGSARGCP